MVPSTRWVHGCAAQQRKLCSMLALVLAASSIGIAEPICEGVENDTVAAGSCNVASSDAPEINEDTVLRYLRPSTRCEPYSTLDPRYHYPRSGVAGQKEIPVVNASELKEKGFLESIYYKHSIPVLIRGGAEDVFEEIATAWSVEAILESKYADQELPVSYGGRISQSNIRGSMTLRELVKRENQTVSFYNWQFEELKQDAPNKHWQGWNLEMQKEYFKKLKKTNFFRPKGWAENCGGQFNMHISRLGGALPHSHNPVINVLFQGAKRWILVDPKEIPAHVSKAKFERMDVQPFNSPDKYGAFQWFKDVGVDMPEGMPFWDFVQEEGEAVYVPPMYTHATVDLCSITFGSVLGGEFLTGMKIGSKGAGKGRR